VELFVGVIAVVVILFVLHVSHAPEEPKLELQGGTARLTPTEATQLNRIFVLQGSAPDLALQLAAQLWGDAWQLAHVSLCSRLMLLDREEEALELLWKLDSAYREQALQTMLQELVNRGDTDKALQLQKRFDVTASKSPLTHSTLLLAEGKTQEARKALDALDLNQQISEGQLLDLARLRQACDQPEQADEVLARVETQLDSNNEPDFSWRPLLQTLADLQRYPHLLQLAQRSDLPGYSIVELLAAHGRYDEALELLAATDTSKTYLIDAPQLFEHFIKAQRPELLQRLLATQKDGLTSQLLQCHVSWHARRGDITQAQQLLDREMQRLDASVQHWLILSLAEEHAQSNASWATSLRRQAERLLAGEQGKASWPGMRLYHLQHLLREQASRAPAQRDTWSLRNFLEEAERLHAELDPEDSLSERILYSQLLDKLGQPTAARDLLLQLRQQLEAGEDIAPEDARYHYNEIVQALIDMGELEQARGMLTRELADDDMKQPLMTAYLDAGLLEEALACIDLHTLIGSCGTSNLQHLHHSIAALKETDAQRYQRLQTQLQECLNDDQSWRSWGQIHIQGAG
jgi:hypothetical protein